ncbi:hypothetical protein GCM10009789_84100 [Kribbella sancticallisti]|uniref:Uncharacterized protein n=1 Tax=Kribbella sancticallisti TaxID=460087 RepID=A0ABN2EU10_9ACTN
MQGVGVDSPQHLRRLGGYGGRAEYGQQKQQWKREQKDEQGMTKSLVSGGHRSPPGFERAALRASTLTDLTTIFSKLERNCAGRRPKVVTGPR